MGYALRTPHPGDDGSVIFGQARLSYDVLHSLPVIARVSVARCDSAVALDTSGGSAGFEPVHERAVGPLIRAERPSNRSDRLACCRVR
jgi:hypothetical protein